MINPKISFILPVYNVEQYLDQCIKSIINQDYDNKEIILVDDGSTDKSGEICDRYSSEYSYINTVHIPNGGPSGARNEGIKHSHGDYILFVDSDDYIEESVLGSIVSTAVEYDADIVFLEAQKVFPNGSKQPLGDGITKQINGMTKENILLTLADCPKFAGSACTKLIKRELFDIDGMLFECGIYCEDVDLVFKLMVCAKSFAYCSEMYYNYRQDILTSRTHINCEKRFLDLFNLIIKWYSEAQKSTVDIKKYILNSLAYEYMMVLYLYGQCGNLFRVQHKNEVCEYLHILKYRTEKKYKLIYMLSGFCGIDFVSKLFVYYLNFR